MGERFGSQRHARLATGCGSTSSALTVTSGSCPPMTSTPGCRGLVRAAGRLGHGKFGGHVRRGPLLWYLTPLSFCSVDQLGNIAVGRRGWRRHQDTADQRDAIFWVERRWLKQRRLAATSWRSPWGVAVGGHRSGSHGDVGAAPGCSQSPSAAPARGHCLTRRACLNRLRRPCESRALRFGRISAPGLTALFNSEYGDAAIA